MLFQSDRVLSKDMAEEHWEDATIITKQMQKLKTLAINKIASRAV